MFDLYVTICDKNMEVMILDHDVLHVRSYLQRNHECNRPLNFFVNYDWLFENTAQYHPGVSLNLEYKLNLLHNTHKR